MPAVAQGHPHYCIAWLQQGKVDRHVGLAAAMGLNVGVLGLEQLLCPFDGQGFDGIDVWATGIVTAAGVAFGILIGQDRALCSEYRFAGVVLSGNEVDGFFLVLGLLLDDARDFHILAGFVTQFLILRSIRSIIPPDQVQVNKIAKSAEDILYF